MSQNIEISKLKFPDFIREKPGMYIGETTHPTNIVRELIDNSIDEAINKFADKINILVDNKSNYSLIQDNGRGIPIYLDNDYVGEDREITMSLFSETHVGGKFNAQLASVGIHGVGSKATNALSDSFIVIVNIDNYKTDKQLPKWINDELTNSEKRFYILSASKGIFIKSRILTKSELIDTVSNGIDIFEKLPTEFINQIDNSDWWSSTVICKPDSEIFESVKCKYNVRSLKLTKLFNNDISIIYNGTEVTPYNFKTDSFDGMEFINDNRHYEIKFDFENDFELRGQDKKLRSTWYINFGYSKDDFNLGTDGSVNTLETTTGYHVRLIGKFLAQAFREVYPMLSGDDYRYGIRYFTLVFTNHAEYTSQDKVNLGRIYGVDEYKLYTNYFKPKFMELVKTYQDEFDAIVNRIIEYKKTIGKLATKDFVNSVVVMGDDRRSKNACDAIYDCSTSNRDEAELFIVEGKSASSGMLKSRNVKINSVLPLRGKVLNVSNLELEDALNNKEILNMINGIGVGIHPFVDLSKRRYGKIIITTDADIDGSHIALLVCGAFAHFLPEVIEAGMLYIALAPLYEQKVKGKPTYHWDESTLLPRYHTIRYKGIGSCDPYVLKDTVINPETRRLIKVTMKDKDKALELLRDKNARKDLMIKEGILVLDGDKSYDFDSVDIEDSINASNDGFDYTDVKEMEE